MKRRTQVKNEIQAVLQRNLKPRPPVTDLFGKRGRAWLPERALPIDERLTVDGSLRQLDFGRGEGVEIASEELHQFPRRQVGVLDPDAVAAVEEWARTVLRRLKLAHVDAVGKGGGESADGLPHSSRRVTGVVRHI